MKLRYTLPILLFLCTLSVRAQLTPEAAIAAMGRGINLGNTLEPPREGDWNNGPAEEAYFDAYLAAGFTNVRIPVRWDEHTAETAPYTIDPAWLDRVEEVVDWGLERELYVTLNGHHEDWLKQDYATEATRARYDAIWEQIVARFGDKSERLLFEIINEPFGMTVAQVDDLNARILGIIRERNPTRLVIFGGNEYANAEQLVAAAVPQDDYVIGYFHSYDPWSFAGQGTGTWGTEGDYAALDERFRRVAAWSEATGVPVHLSEFGAVLAADYNSRMRFYAAYVENALRYGFAFSVWDDGGDFRILDREDLTWPDVKDVLINFYPDSPTDVLATAPDEADPANLRIDVSWTNRAADAPITVERRTEQTDYTTVATLAAGTTTYTDTDLTIGNFYSYRLVTRRADGTLLQSYPARVLLAGAQDPYGDTPVSLPGRLEAENYDLGGEGVAYHDSEADNIPGGYRPDEGVDVGGNGAGGFAVGYISRGEWLEYTLTVDTEAAYYVDAAVASAVGNGSLRVSNSRNGSAVTVTVPADGTGDYDTFETVRAGGTLRLDAGEQVIRIDFTGEQPFNLDYLDFGVAEADDNVVVNYADGLDTAYNRFTGSPAGVTFAVADGVLTFTGDGTAPPYQTFRYDLPDELLVDVPASNNLLFIGARTLSGEPVNLRIDLIDENENATTNAGRTAAISGTDFRDYAYNFTDGYQDGGYGGTGCTANAPCPVNGNRIVALAFYPEPAAGGFEGTVQIDYISFGAPYPTGGGDPTGLINYQDDLTGAGDRFEGSPAGITYSVVDGELIIVGDGTAPAYQTLRYSLRGPEGGPVLADAVGSGNLLYLRARTGSGAPADLRVDLIDNQNFHTTLAGRTVAVSGDGYAVYSFDYTDGYADGGYGGTACTEDTQPCPVDGRRIAQLALYVDPAEGMFADSLLIDWIAFGRELSTEVRDPFTVTAVGIYPNPTGGDFTVSFDLPAPGPVRFMLYDAAGRTVRRVERGAAPAGPQRHALEAHDLPGGIYFLQVVTGEGRSRGYPIRKE